MMKSALQIFRKKGLITLIKRAITKSTSQSPVLWLLATLAGYYIFRDVSRLVAIESVGSCLQRILYNVEQLDRVRRSDIRVLQGWRWNSVPWRDYMREQRAANFGL